VSLWEQVIPFGSRLWTKGSDNGTSARLAVSDSSTASGKPGNWDDRVMKRSDGYLLDNRQTEAGERFEAFATLFDPTTFRHLERLGIDSGRRCWEVGAGGTSVVSWLAEKVGPTGQVLATDIDTSLLAPVARQIALTVTLEIQPGDTAAAPDGILPDRGVHGATLPLDVAGKSDVHR